MPQTEGEYWKHTQYTHVCTCTVSITAYIAKEYNQMAHTSHEPRKPKHVQTQAHKVM